MKTTVILIFAFEYICALGNVGGAGAPHFRVDVHADGAYSIRVNEQTWLNSGDTAFFANRRNYSTGDQSLKLINRHESGGSDSFGPWTSISLIYQLGANYVNATIQTYTSPDLPAAIFTQTYLNDTNFTSVNAVNNISSKFPSFQLDGDRDVDLGILAYGANMAGYSGMTISRLNRTAKPSVGLGGGPHIIFDNSTNAIVISPRSAFMASSVFLDPEKQISWGIQGRVNFVPRGYASDFIVFYSNNGINQAMQGWGKYMTTLYQKSRAPRDNDFTLKYLGYWTDAGAYYFYNTEKGKNYEETIIDVVNYINNISVPFRYVQLDQWWYFNGSHDGVTSWTPKPDVLPHGLKYLTDTIKLPLAAQIKFWDIETPYAKFNGGKYNFIPDHGAGTAQPDDPQFWTDFFNETQKWGLLLYEQDWMDRQTFFNGILTSDLTAGQKWLVRMGEAASKFPSLHIQYCMSYGRHILQALEISAVTQARASGDYEPPGRNQWNIGITAMFLDAVNIAPNKDTFFTTGIQPGNPYNSSEPHTNLHSLMATLSTGVVGPGDGIGYINKTLLMRCCDATGLILKPDKPPTAIDDQMKHTAFQPSYHGADGHLYTTHTRISGHFFGIVLGPWLFNDYSLTPENAWPTVQFPPSLAFTVYHPHSLLNFSNSDPIKFTRQCNPTSFCLYYTSPVLQLHDGEQIVIQGELDKWVPMSPQRFSSIQVTGDDLQVQLMVQAKESVTFSYYSVSKSQAKTVVCDNSKGTAPAPSTLISLAKGTCTVS